MECPLWGHQTGSISLRRSQRNLGRTITTTSFSFPGVASPRPYRIQISLGLCWAKWIFIRCTDFNWSDLREKIDGTLGLPPPEPLVERGPNLHYFLMGDNAFAFMPWMVKPYSRRKITREDRLANYNISRGRMVVENAFGILMSSFRVLLGTMGPKDVRDIVLTCVMLHNMIKIHQGGAERAFTTCFKTIFNQITSPSTLIL